MDNNINTASSVDAVITWVDGSDPFHKSKRVAALQRSPGKREIPIAAGRDDTRFSDNGELRYCIASIKKFAPWIRRIFIITDSQVPDFLTEKVIDDLGIIIVDHKEIFMDFEWALPNFNSRSIETVIWRIPGLSPRFIYFNDDFLITKEVRPEDFFERENVILRGSWRPLIKHNSTVIYINQIINLIFKKILGITRTMYLYAQMKAAEIAGFRKKYYRTPHVPHPIRTETLRSFLDKNQAIFSNNLNFRFRDVNQFWPISLANHLEIANGNAILKNEAQIRMIKGERQTERKIKKIINDINAGYVKFLCLESLEKIRPALRHDIDKFICSLLDI